MLVREKKRGGREGKKLQGEEKKLSNRGGKMCRERREWGVGGRFYREKRVFEGKKGEKSADVGRIGNLWGSNAREIGRFFRQ